MPQSTADIGGVKLAVLAFAVLILAGLAVGQVQTNSPEATFLVNGQAGRGFNDTLPLLVANQDLVTFQISGLPNSPYGVGIGFADEVGFALPPAGIVNISPFIVVASGFEPGLFTTFNTGPGGTFMFTVNFNPLIAGTEFTLQCAVQGAANPVLSAPCTLHKVPGNPVPPGLALRSLEPGFSAGNRHAILADINNDGHLDYINSAGIFTGDGAFGFNFAFIDPGGVEAAVADLFGDANPELVVLDSVFNGLRIFEGNGTADYVNSNMIQLPVICGDMSDVCLVDLDGDADLDILVADGETSAAGITRFENFGDGTFFLEGPAFLEGSRTVTAADLDGDGSPEWIFDGRTRFQGSQIAFTLIFFGDKAPSYGFESFALLNVMPEAGSQWLRPFDMDGDGDMDLLWAGEQHQGVLLNDGNANFTYSPISVPPVVGMPAAQMTAADVDGDGFLDVCFVNRSGSESYCVVAHNDGAGGFATSWFLPVAANPTSPVGPGHVLAADLDGDGDDDLAVGGYDVTFLVNDN